MADIPLFCSSFLDPRTIGRSPGALAASLVPKKLRPRPINCIETSSSLPPSSLELLSTNVCSDGSVVFRFGAAEDAVADSVADCEVAEFDGADSANLGIAVSGFPSEVSSADGESVATGAHLDETEASADEKVSISVISIEEIRNVSQEGEGVETSASLAPERLEKKAADASAAEIPVQMKVNIESITGSEIIDLDGRGETGILQKMNEGITGAELSEAAGVSVIERNQKNPLLEAGTFNESNGAGVETSSSLALERLEIETTDVSVEEIPAQVKVNIESTPGEEAIDLDGRGETENLQKINEGISETEVPEAARVGVIEGNQENPLLEEGSYRESNGAGVETSFPSAPERLEIEATDVSVEEIPSLVKVIIESTPGEEAIDLDGRGETENLQKINEGIGETEVPVAARVGVIEGNQENPLLEESSYSKSNGAGVETSSSSAPERLETEATDVSVESIESSPGAEIIDLDGRGETENLQKTNEEISETEASEATGVGVIDGNQENPLLEIQGVTEVSEDHQEIGTNHSNRDMDISLVDQDIQDFKIVPETVDTGEDVKEITVDDLGEKIIAHDDTEVSENTGLIDEHGDQTTLQDGENPSTDEVELAPDMESVLSETVLESSELGDVAEENVGEHPINEHGDDEIMSHDDIQTLQNETKHDDAIESSDLKNVIIEAELDVPVDDDGAGPAEDEIIHDADSQKIISKSVFDGSDILDDREDAVRELHVDGDADKMISLDDAKPSEDKIRHDAGIEQQIENLKPSNVDTISLADREISDDLIDLQNTNTESSSKQHRYVLSSGAAMLPHPSKMSTGGEDAYFIASENWLGVADGVGQWSFEGINAGLFATELMNNCNKLALDEHRDLKSLPTQVLSQSAVKSRSPGSSTALVAFFDGQTFHAANIGDSGFIIIRNGEIFLRSTPMVYGFNFPHQIQGGEDPSEFIQEYEVELEEGDVLVMGTDGLFDNLFEQEIITILSRSLQAGFNPTEMAERLAGRAQEVGESSTMRSPFADAAHAAGYPFFSGGKLDDVTVLVSLVIPS